MAKLVYIAGPYSAPTKLEVEANINTAREVALWCVSNRIYYICPHLNSAYFEQWDTETPVSFYYEMDEEILSRCDAILLIGSWHNSKGAQAEFKFAVENKKRVFHWFYEQEGILSWYKENE